MQQADLFQISPQGIGDIIGLAYRTTRGNLWSIFRYILVPSLCTLVVTLAFQWIGTYGAAYVAETKSITAAVTMGLVFIGALVVSFFTWWVLGLRLLALVRFVLGFSADLEEADKYMMRRRVALIGLNVITSLIIAAVCIGATLLGFVIMGMATALSSALGGVVSIIWGAIAIGLAAMLFIFSLGFYIFTNCVFACEDLAVGIVIGRAWQLATQQAGRFIWFSVVFYIVYCIINYPLTLPIVISTAADYVTQHVAGGGAGGPGLYKQSLGLLIFNGCWETGVSFLMRPLIVFGFAFLYYDLRLRRDAIDIRRKLALLTTQQHD